MGVLQDHNCVDCEEFLTILQQEDKNVADSKQEQEERLIGLIGKFLDSLKLEQEGKDSKENQKNESSKVNAFNKLAKLIGRQENVFGFISMLKCEDSRNRILELFGKDKRVGKKIERYLERVGKGDSDAQEFFGDLLQFEQEAFLSGGCLNVKVNGNGIKLETSKYFQVADLKRVKIFGIGGKRIMTIVKDETDGRRNYLYTRHAEMELGILWSVPKSAESGDGNDFQNCKVLLKTKNGRVSLKEADYSEDEGQGDLLTFAGKYPPAIYLRGRTLVEVLEKGFQQQQQEGSKEKIRIRGIVSPSPLDIQFGEAKINQVLDDFRNLDVDADTSGSKDDGISSDSVINVNPFDKLAKFYGRGEQNPFLFNYVVQHPGHLETIREVMAQKFGDDSDKKMKRFERRREIYVERMKNGIIDAGYLLRRRQLPGNPPGSIVVEAFTHGNYFQTAPGIGTLKTNGRNIHQNLNVHVFGTGTGFGTVALNTSAVFSKKFPKMTREKSELRRVKIFGNGEKIAKIVKMANTDKDLDSKENWKRNYVFSKRGNENLLDLEIIWNTHDQGNGDLVPFGLVLKIKNGAISNVKKMTFENGVRVKTEKLLKLEAPATAEVLEHSKINREVLFGGKTLYEVLSGFFDKAQKMKMTKMDKKKMKPEVQDDDDDNVEDDNEEFTVLEDAEFAEVDVGVDVQ